MFISLSRTCIQNFSYWHAIHTLIPRIRILDSVTNTYANLEMKDYVKYLGLMIDSNLSWKYHIESICHKISKSIGIIAKVRHYVPRLVLLSVYNSLIVPYLTYGICGWGNCASTFQRKTVTLQKRGLTSHLLQ